VVAWLLFIGALALRLIFLFESRVQSLHFLTRYTIDAWHYWTVAQQMLHGGLTGPFFMPPFYSYVLAGYSLLFGNHLFVLQLVQAALGSGACAIVYLLAKRLFDARVAAVAYVAYLLYGNALFLDTVFLPGAFLVFAELLMLYLLAGRITNRWTLFGAGMLLGVQALIRTELLLAVPFFVIVLFLSSPGERTGLGESSIVNRQSSIVNHAWSVAWFLLGCVALILPTALYNLIAGHEFVLVSYYGGWNLYLANNPHADGTWESARPLLRTASVTIDALKHYSLTPEGKLLSPGASSAYWTAKALDFVANRPAQFLALVLRKLGLFIGNYEVPSNYYYDLAWSRSLVLKVLFLPFGLLLGAGLAGMIRSLRTWPRSYGLYVLFVVYFVTRIAVFGFSRLRAPVVPILAVFAAAWAIALYDRLLRRRTRSRSPSADYTDYADGRRTTENMEARRRESVKSAKSVDEDQKRANRVMSSEWGLMGLALLVFGLSFWPLVDQKAYRIEGLIQAGNIYLDQGSPALARDEYARAARLDPNSTLATYGLFNSAAKLKSRGDAERYSAQLYGLSRTSADSVYAFLGTALLGTMTGDFTRARDYYLKALEKDPQNSDTRYLLALVYHTLKDMPNAKTQVELALSLNPDDIEAQRLHEQLAHSLP
jgi:tetratricopeptide (TPR) repeat protein